MDHGREAARPTTVESTGGHGQLGAAAARRASFGATAAAYHNSAEFARHVRAAAGSGEVPVAVFNREPGPGVVYANTGASSWQWQQPGPLDAVLVGPQLPDVVIQVHDSSFYSALQPRPGAGRGAVLAVADLLPDGAGHGVVFVGLLPGGGVAAYDDCVYYALQPRPGARHGEVLVDLLPDGGGHGEVFVGLLPDGGVAVHDDYGYYPWQPRPGVEVFIGPLPYGIDAVFVNSGNFAQQTLPGTGRADGIAGVLPNFGAGYDGSGPLADDLGAVHDNRGMVAEHLRPLLPFAGIGACSVAVNGLAAGPGSPAVAFHLFALLLGGLFLIILHVLRV